MDGGNEHRPAWRRAAGAVAGLAGVLLAASVALASAYAHAQPAAFPTVDSRPGTCHLAEDPQELSATLSDTAPPVPCTTPHQLETGWQITITGPLAAQRQRPNPELLVTRYASACNDYPRIRAYLGARPQDVYWGVVTAAKFPTRAEWASGVRTMVCDLSANAGSPSGPTVAFAVARFLRRSDSAALRLCRNGLALVTCDLPHLAEATSPNVTFPPGPWPGDDAAAAMASAACTPVVDSYLDADVTSRPDLEVGPAGPTRAMWDRGVRAADCWIVQRGGRAVTGSVRGGFG